MSVAVIIPIRNMASTLERAVLSASGADEIHVVDDASTDNISEVIQRLPSNVIYWRWPIKARCHLEALRTVYHSTACRQIIGMGADDFVMPQLIPALREHAESPVIFSDYAVVRPDESVLGVIQQDAAEPTPMTPDQMRARLQSNRNATETGIGSSLRNDVADWLWDRDWHRLGPHMDSIGYASAAAAFGCLLLPFVGAAYTWGAVSYGRESTASQEDKSKWGKVCREWMAAAGVDQHTADALCRKRAMA
ncbi:glycosyltransferase family 2 protein [bacterium]|nr:glycosyltransferase family 2 protein [bacterium]